MKPNLKAEDKLQLESLENLWVLLQFWKVTEEDPFERAYAKRLEAACDQQIALLQSKMIRRYL